MKLSEVLDAGAELSLSCASCRKETVFDPAFFFGRRGNLDVRDLSQRMICPACGSPLITLKTRPRRR